MRWTATVLATGFAALALLIGWAPSSPAQACSCVERALAESFAGADAVFTGELVSRTVDHPDGGMSSTLDPALHVFAVDAVHKGSVTAEQEVVSADSSASCGLALAGPGPYAVFARSADLDLDVAGGRFAAGLCDGTVALTPEVAAELAAIAPAAQPLAAPAPTPAGTPTSSGPSVSSEPMVSPDPPGSAGPTASPAGDGDAVGWTALAVFAPAGALVLAAAGFAVHRRARRAR